MTCENCAPLLNEYRAEVKALRLLLKAVQEKRHRNGALVELTATKGKAQWMITCAETRTERLIADAIGQHIAKEVGDALRLTNLVFTGYSADEEDTRKEDAAKEPQP